MALLVVEVITKLNLIQYTGLGEVTEMQGRSLDTYGIASGEDFLVHLTDRTRACTRVVPQRLKESG